MGVRLRLMRRRGYREIQVDFHCAYIQKERVPKREEVDPELDFADAFGGREPGIYIELCPPQGDVTEIVLPRDGNTVYQMDDDGNTIDTIEWEKSERHRSGDRAAARLERIARSRRVGSHHQRLDRKTG